MKILGIEIADNTSQLFLRITLFLVLMGAWEILAITGIAIYKASAHHQ